MKTGKLAIRPWLSCPYNEHMLVDLPSSVSQGENLSEIKPPLSAAVSPSHETQTIRSLGHLFSISSPFPWQCFVQVESKYEKEF